MPLEDIFNARVESIVSSIHLPLARTPCEIKLSLARGDVLHSLGREQRCGLEGERQENQSRAEILQQ